MQSAIQFLESLSHHKNEKQLAIQIASLAATSTIVYAAYKTINNKKTIKYKEIPQPGSSYPYVGHMFSLGELPAETASKWHKELGPIIKLRMGVVTWIIVDDPALAHKIFVTNGVDTSHRPQSYYTHILGSKGGKGVAFAQPGAKFNRSRAAALSVLSPKLINENYLHSIKKETNDLVSRLIHASEEKNGIDPLKYLELSSMNVIFLACFGRKFDTVDDPEFKSLTKLTESDMKFAGIENEMSRFLPILSVYEYLFSKQLSDMENFIKEHRDPCFKRFIKESLQCQEPNIVKSLQENGYDFDNDEEDRLVFLFDMIVAGTDTISVSLLWNFAIMCHYPEKQKIVSDEIDQFIRKHGRLPEFTDRKELPYCVSVMKECMRYRPTMAFGLPHAVNRDIVVDDYLIPKGATIVANMLTIHNHPTIYTDPHTFQPERFMNNLKTMHSLSNGKYEERDHYNFGFGRRICPGIHMAELELFYAFTQVFARASIEPVDGVMPDIDHRENGGLTLNPVPYKVKFVKRQDALI